MIEGYGPRFVNTMTMRDRMRAAITDLLADPTPSAQQEIGYVTGQLYPYGFTGITCVLQIAGDRVVSVVHTGSGKYTAQIVNLTDARNP